MRDVKKQPDILKRLERTKEEKSPDLRAMREERDREERARQRSLQQEQVNSFSYHNVHLRDYNDGHFAEVLAATNGNVM